MKLSVHSGPQAGAVEILAVGRWLVGSGDHCDLVLRDAGIQKEHFMLVVTEREVRTHFLAQSQSQLQLQSQTEARMQTQGQAPVDGAAPLQASNPGVRWDAGQWLRLGGTALLWRPEATSEMCAHERPESVRPSGRFEPVDRFERSMNWILAGLAGCMVAGILAVQANRANAGAIGLVDPSEAGSLGETRTGSTQSGGTHSGHQPLLAKLADLKLPELNVRHQPDGSTTVVGWVRDAAELGTVRQLMVGSPIRTAIVEAAEQIRFASEYLQARGQVAAISYEGEGVLRLHVRGHNEAGFRAIVQDLEKAAPQVRRFEIDYEAHAAIPLPGSKAPAVAPLPPSPRPVLAGIDGVSLSSRQRFLTSGQHYVFEGGRLKDGSTILSIEHDSIGLKADVRSPQNRNP